MTPAHAATAMSHRNDLHSMTKNEAVVSPVLVAVVDESECMHKCASQQSITNTMSNSTRTTQYRFDYVSVNR